MSLKQHLQLLIAKCFESRALWIERQSYHAGSTTNEQTGTSSVGDTTVVAPYDGYAMFEVTGSNIAASRIYCGSMFSGFAGVNSLRTSIRVIKGANVVFNCGSGTASWRLTFVRTVAQSD